MPTILDKIVATKREEIVRRRRGARGALRDGWPRRRRPRFLRPALLTGARPDPLIAEVKKASPSKGVIRADFDPVEIARTYKRTGRRASAC